MIHDLYGWFATGQEFGLLGLAVLTGAIVSSSGFALGRRMFRSRDRRTRLLWALAGTVATASAAGATHVVAMLAREPGVPLRLDILPALASYPSILVVAPMIAGLSMAAIWVSVRARLRLDEGERRLRDLTDIAVEGLIICRDETIVGVNRSLERILNCTERDLVGRSVREILPGLDADDVPTSDETAADLLCATQGNIPVRIIGQEIALAGTRHVVIAVRDQRERLRNEARMMKLAHQDALTGLANRLSFTETVSRRFLRPSGEQDTFALLMLDLDQFKGVNDTLGHGIGDELLRRVARRLLKAVRVGDVVARLGGDEFAVLAASDEDLEPIRRTAETIIDLLSRPFLIDGHVIEIGTSIGIALAPGDGGTPADLARAADLALYRAKADGRGLYRLFEIEMNARVQARRSLEFDLRRAVGRREFEVHFQPHIDPRTGEFDGAEALIRWRHPERGMVPPADFIPVAEEIGLIGSIGEWVLRTACTEAARWPARLSVSVNLSSIQLRDARLASSVATILDDTGLSADRLELEITEKALLQDDGRMLDVLRALRELGIRISLDDFGADSSSLSYLRRFPFDKIKIDQSFMRQIPDDHDSVAIVQAIAVLGPKLGMTITAEGVETADQRAFAVREGCGQIQGYLISRPLPADRVAELFAGVPDVSAAA